MNRFFWTIGVLAGAFLISFLLILVLGGIVYSGEEAIGVGMLWYYSLPALIVLSVLSGWFSYRWYFEQRGLWLKVHGLILQAVVLAVSAPVVTYMVFWVRAVMR